MDSWLFEKIDGNVEREGERDVCTYRLVYRLVLSAESRGIDIPGAMSTSGAKILFSKCLSPVKGTRAL